MTVRAWPVALGFVFFLGLSQTRCGGTDPSTFGNGDDAGNGGDDGSTEGSSPFGGGGGGKDAAASQPFDVAPSALQTITVAAGAMSPTVTFNATIAGAPTAVGWTVDRGDIGSIAAGPTAAGVFAPSGKTGGVVTISAGKNGKIVKRQVFVKLMADPQNGVTAGNAAEAGQIPADVAALSAGGGVGGVGGEGLGGAATPADVAALGAPGSNGSAQSLGLLYPYDQTIFPRGQRAPLLMWSWTTGDADAIKIDIATSSGSYAWSGTFGRPAILTTTGGNFIRHPIPQDVWDAATNTAGGVAPDGTRDTLKVSLTVASGGIGYGPISETWRIAPARLSGTVYYNSYGTQLVKNWTSLDKQGHSVGAAILGVRSGDNNPKLIVGQNSPVNGAGNPKDDSGCRVCHVVASKGRWLVTQAEQGVPGNGRSFLYDLQAASIPASGVQLAPEGVFGWIAMTGDATYGLTNTINPSSTNPAIANSSSNTATSSFWTFGAAPAAATLAGLPAGLAAGYPSYSPDDKMIAWVDVTGATSNVMGSLYVANYNGTTHTLSAVTKVAAPAANTRIGYPVFLPDNSALIYETQVRNSQSDSVMVTRNGARSELWMVNLKGAPTPFRLSALNGMRAGASYLPSVANNHGIAGATDPRSSYSEVNQDDTTLNYEPTLLPLVEGGYAWVVFTARRVYGNQLTAVPWQSWPPDYDTTSLGQATVKKLWVAAIDLTAPAGSDPSFPAFYLPAQELLAGNSRGFWTLDPCRADGTTCDAGDECCGGYCEPGAGGALTCTNAPPNNTCASAQDKCVKDADCCDGNHCIAGFCASVVH